MASPGGLACGVTCAELNVSERHVCDLQLIISTDAGQQTGHILLSALGRAMKHGGARCCTLYHVSCMQDYTEQ